MIKNPSSNRKCHVTAIKKTGKIKVFPCQITERNSLTFFLNRNRAQILLSQKLSRRIFFQLLKFFRSTAVKYIPQMLYAFIFSTTSCNVISCVMALQISVKVKVDVSDLTVVPFN